MRQANKIFGAAVLFSILLIGGGVNFASAAENEGLLIGSRPVKLREHTPPPRANLCQNCHMKKDKAVFPRKGRPNREHGEISNIHGKIEVSCHNCHDPNNSNFLRSPDNYKTDFRNPSPVCSTCHAIIFQEWRRGLHGKRMSPGADGVREQFHCIDCHNPHSVKFKKMEARPAPKKPKFLNEKHEESANEGSKKEHSGE